MENDRGTEETWSDWDGGNRNVATGAILASAVAAGVEAYLIRRRRLAEVERKLLSRALDRTSGNRHAAARLLGIDIARLERGLAEHRLGGRSPVEDADGER